MSDTTLVLTTLLLSSSLFLSEDFENGLPPLWSHHPVRGLSARPFELFVEKDGNHCLRAESRDDFRLMGFSPHKLGDKLRVQQHPFFSWRWKTSRVLQKADARKKSGDDFAARLYVLFARRSWLPGAMRVLVYVWDNQLPVGTLLPNSWAPAKEKMIVLQSGDEKIGSWIEERRDVYRDFKRAFPDEEPGPVRAVTIACDTDQTGEVTTLYFDDLRIEVGEIE